MREDPYYSDIPEWLQEFRVNLVDDRVPEHRDSHASSSHELSLEPTPTRSAAGGPKSQGLRAEDALAELYFVQNFLVVTADHKVLSEGCESRNSDRYAVVVQDLATRWIQSYPCKTTTSQETQRSLQKFLEPNRKPKAIHTDNSLEFGKACEDLSWNHCTSTPHRSETNGIAERAVRIVKEGTSAVLLQPGLDQKWWADSMECYTICETFKISCLMGKLHTKDVLENHLKDQSFHLVHWLSITQFLRKTSQESINLERKSYLDYSSDTLCTRVRIWKGDIMVADIEELETMDASEIYSTRLNAKEVVFSQRNWKIRFPVADGRIKIAGGDQELRTFTLIRENPIRGESHRDFLGEPEGSLPPTQDSLPAGEAIDDLWSMSENFIYLHHVEPGVKLYSPREESFPIPLKYTDVSRTAHTNLDVKQEKRIDDFWNIDGSRDLSDPWTGFTQFTLLEENPPKDICGPGGD